MTYYDFQRLLCSPQFKEQTQTLRNYLKDYLKDNDQKSIALLMDALAQGGGALKKTIKKNPELADLISEMAYMTISELMTEIYTEIKESN